MEKTNFDEYLEEQLLDPAFAARFAAACDYWDTLLDATAATPNE
jgi:hypothetical protein